MKKLYRAIVRRATKILTEDHSESILRDVADKLFYRLNQQESVEDNVCNTIVQEHIDVDQISKAIIDNFDYDDIAYNMDWDELAHHVDTDDIAASAAEHIDYKELAQHLSPVEKLAGAVEVEQIAAVAAEKVVSSSHMSTLVEKMLNIAADKLLARAESMSEDITVDYLAD